jgi:8-oxo-dGTP diphosphatase
MRKFSTENYPDLSRRAILFLITYSHKNDFFAMINCMGEEKTTKLYEHILADIVLVLIKDNQVLLARRYNTGYQDGNYRLIGGHLEKNETVKEGIIREAKEEIGIVLLPKDLKIIHIMHRFDMMDRIYFSTYLQAEKWSGEITNMEPNKCNDLKWFEFNRLPENMALDIKLSLKNISKKVFFSEYGFEKLK